MKISYDAAAPRIASTAVIRERKFQRYISIPRIERLRMRVVRTYATPGIIESKINTLFVSNEVRHHGHRHSLKDALNFLTLDIYLWCGVWSHPREINLSLILPYLSKSDSPK